MRGFIPRLPCNVRSNPASGDTFESLASARGQQRLAHSI